MRKKCFQNIERKTACSLLTQNDSVHFGEHQVCVRWRRFETNPCPRGFGAASPGLPTPGPARPTVAWPPAPASPGLGWWQLSLLNPKTPPYITPPAGAKRWRPGKFSRKNCQKHQFQTQKWWHDKIRWSFWGPKKHGKCQYAWREAPRENFWCFWEPGKMMLFSGLGRSKKNQQLEASSNGSKIKARVWFLGGVYEVHANKNPKNTTGYNTGKLFKKSGNAKEIKRWNSLKNWRTLSPNDNTPNKDNSASTGSAKNWNPVQQNRAFKCDCSPLGCLKWLTVFFLFDAESDPAPGGWAIELLPLCGKKMGKRCKNYV